MVRDGTVSPGAWARAPPAVQVGQGHDVPHTATQAAAQFAKDYLTSHPAAGNDINTGGKSKIVEHGGASADRDVPLVISDDHDEKARTHRHQHR